MKKTIIVVALLIALSSCKHCYQCKYSQETIIAPQVSGQVTFVTSEFCGTKKERDAYIKAGTSTAKSGNVTIKTTTNCN